MRSIAIAILNWNGKKLLKRFLKKTVDNSPEATLYLIDNASTDDSVAYTKKTTQLLKSFYWMTIMDMQVDTTKDWSSLKRTSFACSTMMFW